MSTVMASSLMNGEESMKSLKIRRSKAARLIKVYCSLLVIGAPADDGDSRSRGCERSWRPRDSSAIFRIFTVRPRTSTSAEGRVATPAKRPLYSGDPRRRRVQCFRPNSI